MIWRDALLDLMNNLRSLVGTFGLKVVPFGFGGFVHHKLEQVSLTTTESFTNSAGTAPLSYRRPSMVSTYLEIRWMPPCDFTSHDVAKMHCCSLPLPFKHRLSCSRRHDI
jgi:hypothetical protein